MTKIINVVQARAMGRSFATDQDLQLPVKPRLIPELVICPIGKDGLLFAGTQSTQVIRGRSSRQLLPLLLPLLDGTRTQEDLRAMVPNLGADNLRDVLSLLFSRGLFEDGCPDDIYGSELSETASFLGRYNDVSRRNRNRSDGLANVTTSSVRVCGPIHFAESVLNQLAASGVSNICYEHNAWAGEYDLTISISTGDKPMSKATLDEYVVSSKSIMLIRLGEKEAHIGPRLVRGMTVCPACFTRMHPHPVGSPDPLLAELWLSLAAQQTFVDLSHVGLSSRHRSLDQLSVDASASIRQQVRLAPRMPGCQSCGIMGEPWTIDDPRLLAWLYHEGTSIPRRCDISPKDHQKHYLSSNLSLSAKPGPLLHSSSICRLPDAESLDILVPWARGDSPPLARHLSLGNLSTLLARIAGETGEGTSRRRIAPTGGNLGSVRLWVLVRDVDGLGRGAYLYDPREHSLALRGGFDDSELGDTLGTRAELPPCVVLGAGDLAKCTQKYQSFAYRLIQFDAGIALSFAHVVAESLGLLLREYADFDVRLPDIFGIPRRFEYPHPTFALGIYVASIPDEPELLAVTGACRDRHKTPLTPEDYVADIMPRILSSSLNRPSPTHWNIRAVVKMPTVAPPRVKMLEHVLHLRRAVRHYSSNLPSREILEAVMTLACEICASRAAVGAPPTLIRPILMVPGVSEELLSGVYEFDQNQSIPLIHRSAFDSRQARKCINQLGLARSPASLVIVGDLRTALTKRMSRGYADIMVAAGAAIGMAWLASCSYGLVGTAAGGVIAHGFREVTGMDGFNECPLLALHIGLPIPA